MDKASGVYLKITNNSFQSSGFSDVQLIIPMLTKRGKIGLNEVNGSNYKDILGYDTSYNPNYVGLGRILENVAHAKVWRINHGAHVANVSMAADANAWNSTANVVDPDTLKTEKAIVIANSGPGDWGTVKVAIKPKVSNLALPAKSPTEIQESLPVIINTAVTESLNGTTILSALKFYDSTNTKVVGIVKSASSNYTIHPILEDGSISSSSNGTVVISGGKTNINISPNNIFPLEENTLNARYYPTTVTELVLEKNDNGVVTEKQFSLDSASEIFWKKVDFGDTYVYFNLNSIEYTATKYKNLLTESTLNNGTDGTSESAMTSGQIDLSVLNNCGCNILLTNGTFGSDKFSIVNRMAVGCEKNKIHMFIDAPDFEKFADLQIWEANITRSKYVSICARPDIVYDENGLETRVFPSTKYAEIFANMSESTQSLNYPPAGPTYGRATVEKLMDCDYELYKDQLKTSRINYLTKNSLGTMMWEQRTTYGMDTDFSYIAPVFIIDELAAKIVDYERNFNFRYMNEVDLAVQKSGLIQILNSYVDRGFLYSYSLKVPSEREAQESGRTLNIKIKVQVAKDSEVINIDLEVTNNTAE